EPVDLGTGGLGSPHGEVGGVEGGDPVRVAAAGALVDGELPVVGGVQVGLLGVGDGGQFQPDADVGEPALHVLPARGVGADRAGDVGQLHLQRLAVLGADPVAALLPAGLLQQRPAAVGVVVEQVAAVGVVGVGLGDDVGGRFHAFAVEGAGQFGAVDAVLDGLAHRGVGEDRVGGVDHEGVHHAAVGCQDALHPLLPFRLGQPRLGDGVGEVVVAGDDARGADALLGDDLHGEPVQGGLAGALEGRRRPVVPLALGVLQALVLDGFLQD